MVDTQQHHSAAGYQAYLVRLWQQSPSGPWRALAKDSRSGEEVHFATLEQLFLFLHGRTTGAAGIEGN
jgi:hypothetical protein